MAWVRMLPCMLIAVQLHPDFVGKMGRLPGRGCFLCMLITIRLVVLCMGLLGGGGAGGWGNEHGALTVQHGFVKSMCFLDAYIWG